jgi:hypothetical protein
MWLLADGNRDLQNPPPSAQDQDTYILAEKYGYIPRTISQDFMRHATVCGHNVRRWIMKSVWDITTRVRTKRHIGVI